MATATATAAQVGPGRLWFRALRAPFLVASVLPVIIGGVLALEAPRLAMARSPFFEPILPAFRIDFLLLTLVSAICIHLATNMLNDNFDFRSGDDLAVNHQNPFAGGGRVLTQRILNVNAHLGVELAFLGLGALLVLHLVPQVGHSA